MCVSGDFSNRLDRKTISELDYENSRFSLSSERRIHKQSRNNFQKLYCTRYVRTQPRVQYRVKIHGQKGELFSSDNRRFLFAVSIMGSVFVEGVLLDESFI